MGTRMKTTIEVGDALLAEAKAVAAREETTLRELVEAGLRRVLAERRQRQAPFRLRRVTVKGRGLRPEWRDADWTLLRDAVYDTAPR